MFGLVPNAAVVLTRKAVEVICASLGFTGNLGSTLQKMRASAVIDERLWAWSDLLRRLGNAGAHDLEEVVTDEDARDGIWFAVELSHQVFVVQPRYEKFAGRRTAVPSRAQLRVVGDRPELARGEGTS